jgi:large subunit ribosomal protein L6
MSRIGRRPIRIPEGVRVECSGRRVQVSGPRGALERSVPTPIEVEVAEGEVRCRRPNDRTPTRALHGLTRALVANMVTGVTQGFRKELEVEGVGYRAEMKGGRLNLTIGFSHPVSIEVPRGLAVTVEGSRIRIEGTDRERVGQFAADVRGVRPPEPYKGKGIRYAGETIRRKVGKAGAA